MSLVNVNIVSSVNHAVLSLFAFDAFFLDAMDG